MSTTLISQPISPMETFTHHVWSFSSNAANIRQLQLQTVDAAGNSFTQRVQSSLAGTAIFDIDLQEWLRDQVSFDIQEPGTTATAYTAPNSSYTYTSVIVNEYVEVDGKLEILAGTVYPGPQTVVNAARQTYNSPGLPGRIAQTPTSSPWTYDLFLTNSPRSIPIRTGESYTLSLYAKDTSSNRIAIGWLNSAGGVITTDFIDYSGTAGRYDICVGLANLAAAGITPPAGAVGYFVYVANFSSPVTTRQTELFLFDIVDGCGGTRIHFLNRWGGFDAFTLKDKDRKANVSSSIYQKYLQAGYTVQDRGNQYQYRDVAVIYTASTGLISDETALWLEEMVGSPVAYLEEDGQLIPITIDDSTTDIIEKDALEITISFRLANDIHNQRL